jgi:hypothetical protein
MEVARAEQASLMVMQDHDAVARDQFQIPGSERKLDPAGTRTHPVNAKASALEWRAFQLNPI